MTTMPVGSDEEPEQKKTADVLQHADGSVKENVGQPPKPVTAPIDVSDNTIPSEHTLKVHQAARSWMQDIAPEVEELFNWAARRSERGTRTTQSDITSHVQGRVTATGEDFKVNNDHMTVLVRELLRARPQCRGKVELRKSRFDPLYPDVCGDRHGCQ